MSEPVLRAAACGTGVLIAGFGALNVFALLATRQPSSVPGLYDFASATWGDGIALPVMTAALVNAICVLPPARQERGVTWAAAAAGGTLGTATQVLWLRDDAPHRNWTLPSPHHFTAAGWYHAAFLIGMCALTGALSALLITRLAAADRRDRRATRGPVLVAVLAAGAFAGLLMIDSRGPAASAHATRYALAAGALLLAGTAAVMVRRRRGR